MMKSPLKAALAGSAAVLFLGTASAAMAAPGDCTGAGVITRIQGGAGVEPTAVPTTVIIARGGAQVARPRVLEVICVGDRISVTRGSRVTLSLDGRGNVTVDPSTPITVAARAGAPSLAGNAYRAVNDQVMPDMKRLPWNVRLKAGDPFAFTLETLAAGGQELTPGTRALMIRVMGGQGPYTGVLTGPGGTIGQATGGENGKLQFPSANLVPGRYQLVATDTAGGRLTAEFTVAPKPEGLPTTYQAIEDPEVRAAATAAALARAEPNHILEAQQVLASAPVNGLDRDRVYDLIDSYAEN